MKMSDKLRASFDAWGKKMFFIPSTHIFSEYFSSYSSGSFDLTLFLFWFKGWRGKKNLQDVSFIYCRKHLRPGFKVDFWISTLTHACREAGLTSWDESSMKVKRCVWLTHRTSDVLTQTSVSRRGQRHQCDGRGCWESLSATRLCSPDSDLYYASAMRKKCVPLF